MNKPTIHLNDPRWKKALDPHGKTVEAACKAAGAKGVVSVVLADDAFVQNLNKQYRGKNKPTNVLSFPNEEEPLGDVILAYETVAREAKEQKKTIRAHATHLIVHGVLHLMGHDHEDAQEADAMEEKEGKILAKLGISNPYL